MEFYKVLQRIMEERHLTAAKISRMTGIPGSTIRNALLNQAKSVTLDVAFKLANGLNISLEELNGEELPDRMCLEVSAQEQLFVTGFRRLNGTGQGRLLEQLEDMLSLPRYHI